MLALTIRRLSVKLNIPEGALYLVLIVVFVATIILGFLH